MHARVEDAIRTGKDCGIGKFPSQALAMNKAQMSASLIAATLLAWLKLLALDGSLARAEPKTLRYRILHTAGHLARGGRRRQLMSPLPGPGPLRSPPPSSGSALWPTHPDHRDPALRSKEGAPRARGTPGHPARQPGSYHPRSPKPRSITGLPGSRPPRALPL